MMASDIIQIITIEAQYSGIIFIHKSKKHIAYRFQCFYTNDSFSRNTD